MKKRLLPLILIGLCLVGCTGNDIQPDNGKNNNVNNNIVVADDDYHEYPTKVETHNDIDCLTEVPDYIANRGIILRGKKGENTRSDVETKSPWYVRYQTDCNLSIESSEEELIEFAKNISEDATFYGDGEKTGASIRKLKKSGSPEYMYDIVKSPNVEDVSQGYRMHYFEEGMSCGTEVFYDPSGKFLLDTACWGINDDVVLKFLEPVMTEVSVNSVSSDDEEVVQDYIDAMHNLEASLTDKKPYDVLGEDDAITVIFTSKDFKEFTYRFTGEKYLIYNDEVYDIGSYVIIRMLADNTKEEYVPERVNLEATEVQGEKAKLEKDGWSFYYSSEENVYVKQKAETEESAIVDGDVEIPVKLATGAYGPYVEKFDVDDDGEDEILIAECEGTGTGMCVYGLCIVDKNDDGYVLTRYDCTYFTQLIEDRIGMMYDNDTREVTIYEILPGFVSRYTGYSLILDNEAELKEVVWSDIIRVYFEDGKVYMSAPSGYVFEGAPMPDYEQAIEVKAQLLIDTDSNIKSVFWYIQPDEN